jgi:hypothetical protein
MGRALCAGGRLVVSFLEEIGVLEGLHGYGGYCGESLERLELG